MSYQQLSLLRENEYISNNTHAYLNDLIEDACNKDVPYELAEYAAKETYRYLHLNSFNVLDANLKKRIHAYFYAVIRNHGVLKAAACTKNKQKHNSLVKRAVIVSTIEALKETGKAPDRIYSHIMRAYGDTMSVREQNEYAKRLGVNVAA